MTSVPRPLIGTNVGAPYDGLENIYVDGEWRPGSTGEYVDDLSPWTGETVTRISCATVDDVRAAVEGARAAQPGWAATTPRDRAQILRNAGELMSARREEITRWLVREVGATITKANYELDVALGDVYEASSMAYHVRGEILPSDVPGKENRVYRQPVGVVAVISPWNFPLNLTSRSIAPAIALGNAVVLKPSEESPVTGGLLYAKVLEEAGLPPGVLQVLTHSREQASDVGDALTTSPVPRFLSFTGSTKVGEGITRKAGIKRLALELGGNAPLVVLDDADLDQAVDGTAFSAFLHQGQICLSGNRLIVDDSVFDAFVEKFVERVSKLEYGDPALPSTFIGPVINKRQVDGIRDKIARSLDQGAKLLLGGDPGGPSGLLLPPHVLVGDATTPTAVEEVFGPVITILRARNEADALRLANDTEYGLTGAVFTGDLERGVAFAQKIEAGMTHVNSATPQGEAHVPFGGEKASGFGRFGGQSVIDEFTTAHWISVQRTPIPYFG